MAISSTTFTRRRSAASAVSRGTSTPPTMSATACGPSFASRAQCHALPPAVTAVTHAATAPRRAPGDGAPAPPYPVAAHTPVSVRPNSPDSRSAETTRSTAATVPTHASANQTTSTAVRRLAAACAAKKSIVARPAAATAFSLERDAHRLALRRLLDLEELRLREASGDEHARERLARVVVGHHGVVVRLAREGDPVLGRRE